MTKRARGSVLSRQKPRKARASRKKGSAGTQLRIRRGLIAVAAVLALVIVGFALLGRGKSSPVLFASKPKAGERAPSVDWKVSLKVAASDQPLSDKAANEILEIAKKNLGAGTHKDLAKTASLIQRLDAYSNVNVLRLAKDQAAVQVRMRQPVMCIEADRLRLVSSDGDVYGTADKDTPGACPGPVLTGIFDESKDKGAKLTLKSDFTLSLNDEEKTAVTEALELWTEGKERGFAFEGVTFKRYRGYFVLLNGRELEIAVGRAPFAQKLDKLKGILGKLADKGEQAARIELDYQGKAFIKLKKL